MRNPYITGGWVSGHEHYGREVLTAHILESSNDAVWLVGNRRAGKTSLLRHLEFLTADGADYTPLFLDMQGSASIADLTAELIYAVEEEERRFAKLRLDPNLLQGQDAIAIIRLLRRHARAAGKKLLLLCDEAEALLEIAQKDPAGLARLRKVFQSDKGLRIVLTSTKVLSRINELTANWPTSPFLFGFGLRNLTGLGDEAATALIRQSQDAEPVAASDALVHQVIEATNTHPFLTQLLCNRLFLPEGRLREMKPDDLTLDSTLVGFFMNDFRWLSPGEGRVLLSAAAGHRDVQSISADIDLPPAQVQDFVYSQERLGQLRQTSSGLAVGNAFLRRWLEQNHKQLLEEASASEVTDEATRQLIQRGQKQEAQYALEQLRIQQANLGELELQKAQYGVRVPLDLINDINHVKTEIDKLHQRLSLIAPHIVELVRQKGEAALI